MCISPPFPHPPPPHTIAIAKIRDYSQSMAESSLYQGGVRFFFGCFAVFFLRNLCVDDNGNIAPPDAPIVKSKTTRNDLNNKLKCTHFLARDLKNCGLDLVASNSVISNPPCLKLNPFPLILFFSHLLSAIPKSPPS